MPTIHFLNVLEGDCNIIQHYSERITVIDVSNAYNDEDTPEEKAVKASKQREEMRKRTNVPSNKIDYRQKQTPDNPIAYLKENIGTSDIFRFIISHPDMDHIDGIKDLFTEFKILNAWDTDNNKSINLNSYFAGYNKEDWQFYTQLRAGKVTDTNRLTYYDSDNALYWNKDGIKILCPSKELVKRANESGDYNDASYVLLYTVTKNEGKSWKIIFAGDSDDHSWEYILKNYKARVSNIDVLFAPHHGRDSGRSYEFLKTLKPRVTLLGNASSNHLAYSCYPPIRITNNQAGYVIIDISSSAMTFYVKNYDFARDYKSHRGWGEPVYNSKFKAYGLFKFDA
ncbi:MAG: MBL fold metallo-hydrolase [Pyrinomonadaceae bacterium]|nr:MBL fold metallo-hydrolase [Pyrinomonadaceae bacterium]